MIRISRVLHVAAAAALLCLTQLASVSHAGISGIGIGINVSAITTPTPAVQPIVTGTFTYGITCTAPTGAAFQFPLAVPAAVNGPTPVSAMTGAGSTTVVSAPNVCTVTQLTRPVAPTGYVWGATPPPVAVSNVFVGSPSVPFETSFANVLALPSVTGVASPLGAGTVTCTGPAAANGTGVCQATPGSGYRFAGFSTDGCGGATQNNPYTTSALTANCTVTAAFVALAPTVVPTLDGWMLLALGVLTLGIAVVCTRRWHA